MASALDTPSNATGRLKVLLTSNTSWYVYNFRMSLIERLVAEGYEVVVLAPFDAYSDRIAAKGIHFIHLEMNNKGTNPIEDFSLFFRFLRCFRAEKPDVVLSYTIKPNGYASIAARFCNVSVINNVSGLGRLFIEEGFATRIARLLYRFALRGSKKVFFQNEDDMKVFVETGLVNQAKAERLPGSGVDTDRFSPASAKPNNSEVVFLLAARMLWDKGVGEFVAAARELKARYPHARFQLLGFLNVPNPSAMSTAQMDDWVEEGVVTYLGQTDNVARTMQAADCIVLPSSPRRRTQESARSGKCR